MNEYIKFQDVDYPISVDYYAVRAYEQMTGKNFGSIGDMMSNHEIMFWCSLQSGADLAGTKIDPETRKKVIRMMDDHECFSKYVKLLYESQMKMAKALGVNIEEEVKKAVDKKK